MGRILITVEAADDPTLELDLLRLAAELAVTIADRAQVTIVRIGGDPSAPPDILSPT